MAIGQGRTKGARSKSTMKQEEKARELGIDPFEVLLLFAAGDWKRLGYLTGTITKYTKNGDSYEIDRISPELRQKSAADACQYLLPKLKAIEIKSNFDPMKDDRPLKNMSNEDLDRI
jgi:hypothetical protein